MKVVSIDEPFITYDKNTLLEHLKEDKVSPKDTNKLLDLIENSGEDEEDVFLKLSYHLRYYETNTKETIKNIIERFFILMERYTIYRGYESRVEWAKAYNDEFGFINFNDYNDISDFFDTDLQDLFIKELKENVELGDLKDNIDNLDLEELLKTLQEKGILEDLPFSLSPYIYWEGKIKKLANYGFIIEYWSDNIVIVEE